MYLILSATRGFIGGSLRVTKTEQTLRYGQSLYLAAELCRTVQRTVQLHSSDPHVEKSRNRSEMLHNR